MTPLFTHPQRPSPLLVAVLVLTVVGMACFAAVLLMARQRYLDDQHALLATTQPLTLHIPAACRIPAAPGEELVIRVRRNPQFLLDTTCNAKPQWRFSP